MRLLLRSAARDLVRHRSQAILAVLSVALGVALGTSVDLANQSTLRAFGHAASTVEATATHELIGGSEGVSTEWLTRLDGWTGVRRAVPVVELVATLQDRSGPPIRILGIDPLRGGPLLRGDAGNLSATFGFERFLTEPLALVSETLQARWQLRLGHPLVVVAGGRSASLEIGGVFTARDVALAEAFENTIFVDIATAQEIWGRPDRVTRVELDLLPGAEVELAKRLPPHLVLSRRGERSQELDRMTAAFRLNLRALSWLSLLCGLFLLFQALHLTTIRRREELARLRALGASRKQLLVAGWVQTAAFGGLGVGAGLLLGVALARLTTQLVLGTVQDLYFAVAVGSPVLELSTLLRSAATGLLGTAIAAALPLWQAAQTDPRGAFSRVGLERATSRWLPRAAAFGLGGLAMGYLGVVSPWLGLGPTFGGLLLLLLGSAALLPWVFARTSQGLSRWEILPVLWRATTRAVATSLSRTGPAVVALALACSVGIAVIVSIESLRKEVVGWLDEILPGDLYISPPARPGMEAWAKVPPELVEAVEKLPGVQQVEPLRLAQLARPGEPSVRILGVRADSPNLKAQRLVSGKLETALPPLRQGRGIMVSEPLARREGLEVGARWRLPLPQGWTEFEVVAVHADFATDQGAVLLDLTAFEKAFGPGPPSALAVFTAKGQVGKHAQLLVRSLAQTQGMVVQSNQELRAESLRLFDKTFQVAHALRYLTLLVAVLGVASGLVALELERGQELATLVALGIAPRARQGFVLLEAIWIGTVAVAASVPLGLFLAYGLLEGINRKSFGWTVTLSPDWSLILFSCLTTLFAATAASWWPARRAARFDPVPYLRFE